MSSARATALVAGRELSESFRRKTLWIVLAILFVGSSLAMILPEVLESGSTRYDVAVVARPGGSRPADFEPALRANVAGADARVRFERVASIARARTLVDDGDADVAVVLERRPRAVVRAGEHDTLLALVRPALAASELRTNLARAGLDAAATDDALRLPRLRVQEVAVDNSDRGAAAAVLSLVLYCSC